MPAAFNLPLVVAEAVCVWGFYHSANSSNLISPSPFLSSVSITSSSCFFVTPAQKTINGSA